ncbi:fungal-specific transcription factor domain-containing protein [Xylariales sp. PMI_506]|nr:fungal-specific transcription factor domain-containing protein [Xylariales sp. PMI_506]
MPAESSARRIKNRTGCSVCKKRRVKCDEQLPGCRQCARRGLECTGYEKPMVWKWRPDAAKKIAGKSLQPENGKHMDSALATFPIKKPPLVGSLARCDDGISRSGGKATALGCPVASLRTLNSSTSSRNVSEDYRQFTSYNEIQTVSRIPTDTRQKADKSNPYLYTLSRRSNGLVLRKRTPQHQPTYLISHYVKNLSRSCSQFNSHLNPFQTAIMPVILGSETLFLLIQAMAAAHLSLDNPELRVPALLLRNQAIHAAQCLINGSRCGQVTDDLMLIVFFLGLSAPLFEVTDVGAIHIYGARAVCREWLQSTAKELNSNRALILTSFVYWQSMYSFVGDDPVDNFCHHISLDAVLREIENNSSDNNQNPGIMMRKAGTKLSVMPLTGLSVDLFNTIGKIGALSRARQLGIQITDIEDEAAQLETFLLDWKVPAPGDVADMQDENTSPTHIVLLSEAIRLAGLLQLYSSSNGGLLQERMRCDDEVWRFKIFCPWVSSTSRVSSFSMAKSDEDPLLDNNKCHDIKRQDFLVQLAIRVLEVIRDIPPTSGTLTIQPLPLAMAAAWITRTSQQQGLVSLISTPTSLAEHGNEDDMVPYWRHFIRARLGSCKDYMGGLLPVVRIQAIVEEVWRRNGASDGIYCDWITLITSQDFQTLLA